MTKPEVRELARKQGLALAEKPDSQEICFVPGGDYKRFIDAYLAESGEALPDTAGELVTANGEVIGEHGGIHNFTVGQRKGLGVATGSPLYVIQINGADKQVVVGGDEHLYSRTLHARRVNLISVDELREPMRVSVKIRHRHEPAPGMLGESRQRRGSRDFRSAAARHHSRPGRGLLRRRHSCRRRVDRIDSTGSLWSSRPFLAFFAVKGFDRVREE